MEMFRCPTCLTLLEGGEPRRPACRSRLGKRSKPIVLGENARITARPPFVSERDARPRERELEARAVATTAEDERRRRVANAIDREDTGRVAVLVFTPEPEPVDAELVWTPEPPATEPVIDLTAETEIEPEIETETPAVHTAEPAQPPMEVHEMFEALHRKARGEIEESPFPIAAAKRRAAGPAPLRLTGDRPEGRRQWSFEVGRQLDEETDDA